MNRGECVKYLEKAEIQYKYALALNTLYNNSGCQEEDLPELPYLHFFTWGKHWADEAELRLTMAKEKLAVMLIEHSAVYLMSVAMDRVLEEVFNDRFNHKNDEIRNTSIIIRLIRNSFAHNPFSPTWIIDRKLKNKIFSVGTINLDTTKIVSKAVHRRDYGGPLALLWLSQLIKRKI